jgi:lipopolysaccharide heptosyltransferase II
MLMTDREAWANARNLLCIRLDALGDVLMTTPAIRALKESGLDRRITLLTSPSGAAAAPLLPEVDDCWIYEAPWMKASASRPSQYSDCDMIGRIAAAGFDAAVIFTVFSQNPLPAALLCYLASVPLRLAHCRENPYWLLTDWVCDPEVSGATRHEVRRQLDLVATIGARPRHERLSLCVPAESRRRVRAFLRRLEIDPDTRWVVIHPGASAPSRRYRPAGFAEVARRLVLECGCRVLFTGDASERALVDSTRTMMRAASHSLAGELSLAEMAALIERAPLLISNNTGPVHIAAAVGTPVVDLYALTNPQHTPWLVPSRVLKHDVPCQPCYKSVCPEEHHHCLELVEPDAVVRAACELLDHPQPLSPHRRRARLMEPVESRDR